MSTDKDALNRQLSLGATIKAVAASFFGVRGHRAHQEDIARLNPVVVIIVGVMMAIAFILTLVSIVKMVTS